MNKITQNVIQTYYNKMDQNKIEKFTDSLFNSCYNSRKPNQNNNKKNKNGQKTKQKPDAFACSTRSLFQQINKDPGLSKADIDKLELMNIDLTVEDYLQKLIKIHEQQRAVRDGAELYVNAPCFEKNVQDRNQQALPNNYQRPSITSNSLQKPSQLLSINSIRKGSFRKQQSVQKRAVFQRQSELKKNTITNISLQIPTKLQLTGLNQKNKQKFKSSNRFESKVDKKAQITTKINQRQTSKQKTESKIKFTHQGLLSQIKSQQIDDITGSDYNSEKSEQQLDPGLLIEKQVSESKKLEELCYTQIGKRMVNVKQKQIRRQFFNTNLHIRSYVMKNILSYIECMAMYSPNSIFILPNERALHFDPQSKPKQLQQYLEHTKYVEIMKNVNHIIQKNIFTHKYPENKNGIWSYIMVVLFVLLFCMVMAVFFYHNSNEQINNALMVCTGLLMCVILVVLIGFSLRTYSHKTQFVPVCEIIYQNISNYFNFLNGKMENDIIWEVGEAFLWLEVKIKIKMEEEQGIFENKKNYQSKLKMYQKEDEVIENS